MLMFKQLLGNFMAVLIVSFNSVLLVLALGKARNELTAVYLMER